MVSLRRCRLLTPLLTFLLGYFLHSLLSHKPRSSETIAKPSINQYLVIFILSSLNNAERRLAVRETWAAELDADVKLYFVVSGVGWSAEQTARIAEEQEKHNDLLLLMGVEDAFDSLTLKVLLAFSWLTGANEKIGVHGNITNQRPFDTFSYVMKCDDDTYVRVNDILDELKTTKSHDKLYWGFFDGRAKVQKSGKYKEISWNICDHYLPYALGGGYILGFKPVHFIASNVEHWKRYRNEDTSVGAWLATFEGIHHVHDPRFDTEYLSRGCHQSYLVTHKHSPADLRKIHDYLYKNGRLCPKEYRTRLSYRYDWNTTPTKCCSRNNPEIP